MPDRFLRAELAQAAAGEAAADGEGQRDQLAGERAAARPTIAPTVAPAYGPAMRPARNDAFERQVGGVVVEQQPRRDAGGERDAEAEREGQPVGPVAALEDQDVAEPPVPDQHRRQRGHDRELDDERREQHLLGGQKLWSIHDLH